MMLCLCHPFSDKDAIQHMRDSGEKCRVAEVYAACTGGESPKCASCVCTLKDIVKSHNKTLAST